MTVVGGHVLSLSLIFLKGSLGAPHFHLGNTIQGTAYLLSVQPYQSDTTPLGLLPARSRAATSESSVSHGQNQVGTSTFEGRRWREAKGVLPSTTSTRNHGPFPKGMQAAKTLGNVPLLPNLKTAVDFTVLMCFLSPGASGAANLLKFSFPTTVLLAAASQIATSPGPLQKPFHM